MPAGECGGKARGAQVLLCQKQLLRWSELRLGRHPETLVIEPCTLLRVVCIIPSCSLIQRKYLDLAELDGMAFSLE